MTDLHKGTTSDGPLALISTSRAQDAGYLAAVDLQGSPNDWGSSGG